MCSLYSAASATPPRRLRANGHLAPARENEAYYGPLPAPAPAPAGVDKMEDEVEEGGAAAADTKEVAAATTAPASLAAPNPCPPI